MADTAVPSSLLSTAPDKTFHPDVVAYELRIKTKSLWSKLIQQRSEFVRVATGVTIFRAQARQRRTAMGGTLLELQTVYSIPGHGHFIRLAEKTLGCGKSTIYRYINLYRDANGIPRPQRNRHLSQSGTDEAAAETSGSDSKRGQICDVKLFFDSNIGQLREWNEAIKLIMLWNEPRCNNASEAAQFAVKKVAAELKAKHDAEIAAIEAEYVDEKGVERNTATCEPVVHKPVVPISLNAADRAIQEEEIPINKRTNAFPTREAPDPAP
jgi:hypothetical protein